MKQKKRRRVCPVCRKHVRVTAGFRLARHSETWTAPPPGAPICEGSGQPVKP
jgi:hypothetical protein